jgi:hypothetical protein
MPIASGVFKTLAYKAETTYGTAAGAAGAQLLRRVSSQLDLTKDSYQSNEIRPDLQIYDMRHGVRRVAGTLSGELSPGTWKDWVAAVVRRDYTAGVSVSGASITIAGSGPTYTVTRAAGSWLTDGVKRGDVGRLTAGTFNAANLNKNLFVTAVTASALTVRVLNGSSLVAEGPIASATFAVTGKKTWMPTSGHTDRSFTVEHWFADIAQSEQFLGVQPTQMDIALPPTGIATVSVPVQGQSIVTGTSQYFTSPTAVTSTGLLASVNGIVSVGGAPLATVTGASVSIQSQRSGEPVIGSNVVPQLFEGRMSASGQLTVYFEDATLRNAFLNETEVEIMLALTSNNDANADFMTLVMPRCKLNAAGKNDGEGGVVQTIPFMALLPATGGTGVANELSTIVLQDSQA